MDYCIILYPPKNYRLKLVYIFLYYLIQEKDKNENKEDVLQMIKIFFEIFFENIPVFWIQLKNLPHLFQNYLRSEFNYEVLD